MESIGKTRSNNFIITLSFLFVLSVFFPYIKILPFRTDIQPNSLLLAAILSIFLLKRHFYYIPKGIIYLSIPFLFSLLIIFFSGITDNGIRSLASYLSVFLISLGTYLVFKNGYKFKLNFLYKVIAIWGIVGFLQYFFFKGMFAFLIGRFAFFDSIGYGERGVSSLSNEPSFYGAMCFLIWIVFITHSEYETTKDRTKYLVLSSLLIQCFLFASSSVSILYFIILVLLYFIFTFRKPLVLLVFGLSFFGSQLIANNILSITENVLGKNRVYQIIETILESKSQLIYIDPSINERYYNIVISTRGFYENYFLPNGFDNFKEYKKSLMNSELSGKYWWTTDKHSRIQSGYGSLLYELGVVGLIIPLVFTYYLFLYFKLKSSRSKFKYVAITMNIVMFSTIPISTPIYSFLIGYFAFKSKEIDFNRKIN